MTAPPRRRSSPGTKSRAVSTPPSDVRNSTASRDEFDFDGRVIAQVDWSIWRAIHSGEFRLAVRCRRCGRWLTAERSRHDGIGMHCATRAVE